MRVSYPGGKVLGELAYQLTSDSIWRAVIIGSPTECNFSLWLLDCGPTGIDIIASTFAGDFVSPKGVVKYVRSLACNLSLPEMAKPIVDTLNNVLRSGFGLLVPGCYGRSHIENEECKMCSCKKACKNASKIFYPPSCPGVYPIHDESEDAFIKRLQKKITAKTWEV